MPIEETSVKRLFFNLKTTWLIGIANSYWLKCKNKVECHNRIKLIDEEIDSTKKFRMKKVQN